MRYDDHARVQRESSQFLWNWLNQLLPQKFEPKACLDIGCGTGYMTQLLLDHYPQTPVHAIDIAPGMLDHIHNTWGRAYTDQLHTHLMDGEQLALEHLWVPNNSLTVSNMCAQWFKSLDQTMRGWLSISNTVVFSVLLEGSFAAWKQAHLDAGEPCGLRTLPSFDDIQTLLKHFEAEGLCIETHSFQKEYLDQHSGGLSFARSLRAIGADTPEPHHRPVKLRKVIANLGDVCTLNHRVGYFFLRRG
ncbi:MAG: methyltransferase domain-containing protein [Limnobacter sp.]|nr:methyltransferase domain-containing protein [Limnobacter sp.]